jgi:drug/metabolite transporter (DMT)-like permease
MNRRKNRLDVQAVALMVLLCALWGLQQVVIKSTNAEIPPALQAGLRSLGAAILVWLWAAASGIPLFRRDGTLVQGVAAGLLFGIEFGVVYWALDFASASHTVLFLYAAPFVVAIGAHYLVPGERLRGIQVLGLSCAFAGLAVGFADAMALPSGRELIGDGLALLAALLWGATTVLIKAGRLALANPAKTLFYQLAVSALVLPVMSLLLGERWVLHLGLPALASLGYQIVIVAFLSYLTWFWLIRNYPAGRVSAFSFLTPLFGMLGGGLFLGEALSAWLGLALVLVALGIYLVNRPPALVAAGAGRTAAAD